MWKIFFSKKWLPTFIEREHRSSESKAIVLERQTMTANNNRILIVGASSFRKTYLTLKILSRIIDQDIYIITKLPPEQYSSSKIITKQIGEENKPLNEYKSANIVFDDNLCSSNSKYINQFLIRGRHNNLDL